MEPPSTIHNQHFHGIEQNLLNYQQLNPLVAIYVAGNSGFGDGVLVAIIADHLGSKHTVQLSVTIALRLCRHLLLRHTSASNGVDMVIAMDVDLGDNVSNTHFISTLCVDDENKRALTTTTDTESSYTAGGSF